MCYSNNYLELFEYIYDNVVGRGGGNELLENKKKEITIEYLYWKKLYYKSLTMNNVKNGMKKWKSCNF